jgi:uncharacterized protein
MSETFLHGVEVVEIDDGIRPIRTVRSSVIGVVGTAPDAAPEVKASLTYGTTSNSTFTATSKLNGVLGNDITIHLVDPKVNNAAIGGVVTGKSIVINLATSSTGVITTTANQVKLAIESTPAANALVGITLAGAGGAVVSAMSRPQALTGGLDAEFPLDTPVLIAGDRRMAARLGATGTLPDALNGIFDQTGAVVVVVRVAVGSDEAATLANVAGGVDVVTGQYKGAWAFVGAESTVGFCPKILVAPGWTHQRTGNNANGVMAEFLSIANRLRAVAIADGPATTDAAAIASRDTYGNKRIYLVDPWLTVLNADGTTKNVPASGHVAGLIARVDNEEGFWVSPSNKELFGILGTSRPIDFTLGDTSSRANLLNEREIATVIRKDGFRLWGNRTCSADQKWAFLSRVRTADMINESILRAHLWAVDRNITRTYFDDVSEGVRSYLSRLKTQGAIAGGNCWADKTVNTANSIAEGRAVFDFDFSTYSPAERVTFRSMLVNDYLEEIL